MKSNIQIESWEIENDTINVYAVRANEPVDCSFPTSDFQKFIDRHEKRDWCYDTQRHGEHYQQTGAMSWEEYYESDCIESDLLEFVLLMPQERIFDSIESSIQKIIVDAAA